MVDFVIRSIIDPSGARRGGRQTRSELEGISRQADRTNSAVRAMSGALAAIGGVAVTRSLLNVASGFQEIQNRIAAASREGDIFEQTQSRIIQISRQTFSSLRVNAAAFARLNIATRTLGVSTLETANVLETINRIAAVGGASLNESTAAMIQLSQALASGRLSGDEFRSVSEQLPGVLAAIRRETGLTQGALRALANDQRLTADIVVRAIQNYRETAEQEFARLTPTINQSFQLLSTNFSVFVGDVERSTGVFAALGSVIRDFANNLDTAGRVVGVVAAALGPAVLLTAVGAATAAFLAFNAVLLANPILAVISLISALVAAFQLFVADIQFGSDLFTTYGDIVNATFSVIRDGAVATFGVVGDAISSLTGPITDITTFMVRQFESAFNFVVRQFQSLASFLETPGVQLRGPNAPIGAGGGPASTAAGAATAAGGGVLATIRRRAALAARLRDDSRFAEPEPAPELGGGVARLPPGSQVGRRGGRARLSDELRRQQALLRSLQTPLEAYRQGIGDLNQLLARGQVTNDQFATGLDRIRDSFLSSQTDALSGFERGLRSIAATTADTASAVENLFTNAFSNLENAVVQFAQTGRFNFQEFANGVIADLTRIALRAALNPIFQSITGALTGNIGTAGIPAGGTGASSLFAGFFQNGGTIPAGRFGIVGERGPELISPGNRPATITPLSAGGNGGPVIQQNIINNSSAQVQTSERQGAGGVTIQDIVITTMSTAISDGSMDRAFRGRFGQTPQVTRR